MTQAESQRPVIYPYQTSPGIELEVEQLEQNYWEFPYEDRVIYLSMARLVARYTSWLLAARHWVALWPTPVRKPGHGAPLILWPAFPSPGTSQHQYGLVLTAGFPSEDTDLSKGVEVLNALWFSDPLSICNCAEECRSAEAGLLVSGYYHDWKMSPASTVACHFTKWKASIPHWYYLEVYHFRKFVLLLLVTMELDSVKFPGTGVFTANTLSHHYETFINGHSKHMYTEQESGGSVVRFGILIGGLWVHVPALAICHCPWVRCLTFNLNFKLLWIKMAAKWGKWKCPMHWIIIIHPVYSGPTQRWTTTQTHIHTYGQL